MCISEGQIIFFSNSILLYEGYLQHEIYKLENIDGSKHLIDWPYWHEQHIVADILKYGTVDLVIEGVVILEAINDVFQPKTGCLISFSGMYQNLFLDRRNRTNSW